MKQVQNASIDNDNVEELTFAIIKSINKNDNTSFYEIVFNDYNLGENFTKKLNEPRTNLYNSFTVLNIKEKLISYVDRFGSK